MYCALLQEEHLATHQHNEQRNQGVDNESYVEGTHTNEPGTEHDYSDTNFDSRPSSYTGGYLRRSSTPPQPLTNRGPASSVAVPVTNLHSPATQPYPELLHTPHPYHQPSARVDNYEWQALNRMHIPSDLMGTSGANEQIRGPHLSPMYSERTTQPSINNTQDAGIALPRVDLHSPAPGTDAEYLEPRRGLHRYFSSADNYKLPPFPRLLVPNDVTGNNEPDMQRKAPHFHRTESDRAGYRPPGSTTNLPQ